MEVLSSRVIVRCVDVAASRRFWCETVGLRTYREYGSGGTVGGVVLFCGGGHLELTSGDPTATAGTVLWLQVVDVDAEASRLSAAGVAVDGPRTEPWGLREAWFDGPDGVRAVLVQVPDDHPIRCRLTT